MKQLSIIVSGKVQGVFFRASAKQKADELGIKGTVTNLPDGRVYIEAQGSDENLSSFQSWCRQGPPRAVVSNLELKPTDLKNFSDFKILR